MTKPHRQRYGLGSFVKKIAKGAKKVFKSPIGKAALLGGGLWGLGKLGGIGSSGIGKNWWSKGLGLGKNLLLGRPDIAAGRNMGTRSGGLWNWIKGNPGKAAMIGAGTAGTLLPFLGGDEEEEIIDDWSVTPDSIAKIRDMARKRDPSLAFLPPAESVMSGYYGSKEGGIVGLANGGNPAEAQAEQMLRMEYQKYRNQGGTMSYQQFKMAVLQQAQGQGPMAQGQPQMAQPQMAAYGGRIGYNRGRVVNPGGYAGKEYQPNISEYFKRISGVSDGRSISPAPGDYSWLLELMRRNKAEGGRMGYQGGELVEDESMVAETPEGMMEENVEEVQGEPTREQMEALAMEIFQLRLEELDEEQLMVVYQAAMEQQPEAMAMQEEDIEFNPQMAQGQMAQPQMAAKGGLMSLGGMEKDYRQEGGFVPLGGEEKADDVPARLSKNEFVFTADAVRAAGGGDIDQGAEVMENVMNNLESGGQISEESQGGGGEEMISEEEIAEGPGGAQEMYDQQQMLQSRMA